CKPVTSKWGDNPYFYAISFSNSNITCDNVTVYTDTKTSGDTAPKSILNVNKVYGYYHNGNDYFLFVQVNFTFGSSEPFNAYIKVSETSYSSFSKDTIVESAGYAAETKITEQPTPSGDDSTNISPSGNENGSKPATNNFERYLLIAVIAVLCVVIIILIFAPNKSRRKQ
ncbi:MAG: hypothetical protein K2G37_03080, partial [Clostridia bacterium]|nr:hypothetical protein [Clostridia bacterium]